MHAADSFASLRINYYYLSLLQLVFYFILCAYENDMKAAWHGITAAKKVSLRKS